MLHSPKPHFYYDNDNNVLKGCVDHDHNCGVGATIMMVTELNDDKMMMMTIEMMMTMVMSMINCRFTKDCVE